MNQTPGDDRKRDLEDIAEDALGVNFRSLRTFRDLFIRPNTVFRAYAAGDRETYTPSLRLWLVLIGLQLAISVLWGGYGGIMARNLADLSAARIATIESRTGVTIAEFADTAGQAAAVVHAPLVGGMTVLAVFLLGAFNRALRWPARLNLTFAVLTAGSVVGLLTLPFTMTGPGLEWVPPLLVLATYFITFYRGAPGVLAQSASGAVFKGAAFSLTVILLVIVGGLLMSLTALAWAVLTLTP
ncbi:MAG: DUF3667 domain-containing protein [Maricaulaceae bacterium]|nr:DUF3667 domain-containing protein [Maricaulaceae bacterium]